MAAGRGVEGAPLPPTTTLARGDPVAFAAAAAAAAAAASVASLMAAMVATDVPACCQAAPDPLSSSPGDALGETQVQVE